MKKTIVAVAVILPLALSACKEPAQPAAPAADPLQAATPAQTPPAAPTVVGTKPAPADVRYPPGPLALRSLNEFCNIESVNGSVYQDVAAKTVSRGQPVNVVGWIVDRAGNRLADDVGVVIEKTDLSKRWEVTGMPVVARQDVADYYKDFPPELLNSGFALDLDLSDFEPGTYHLFIARSSGEERIVCDNSRQIELQ